MFSVVWRTAKEFCLVPILYIWHSTDIQSNNLRKHLEKKWKEIVFGRIPRKFRCQEKLLENVPVGQLSERRYELDVLTNSASCGGKFSGETLGKLNSSSLKSYQAPKRKPACLPVPSSIGGELLNFAGVSSYRVVSYIIQASFPG